jgi:hypothetical protein
MNTNQVSPSTNQQDPNNPQNPNPTPAPSTPTQSDPSAPSVFPGQPGQPQPQNDAPSGQANQTTAKPHPVSRMFDSILKTMSGGPITVTDPTTGERREVPQTKGSMARAITAAALAGLFTPSQYRQTPFGPARDPQASMSAAFNAGKDVTQKRQQEAQQQVDDSQSRKLFTIQNNTKLVQQAAAMAHQQHAVLADTVDRNQKTFQTPLDEWDSQRPAGEPSIYVQKGMTDKEVLSSGHKLTDHNIFIDGYTSKPNPETGVLEDEPTYSVLRTTNADGSPITLKLPESVTTELGKFSKPYEQSYKATGGNVVIPINAYMDAVHTANTLTSVEDFLTRAQKAFSPNATTRVDLATAYKADPQAMWQAINTTEQALASGQGRQDEGGSTDQVIKKVLATRDGYKLLSLIGPVDEVTKWADDAADDRLAKQKIAAEAGKIAAQKAKPITFATAPSIANDKSETPERQAQAKAVLAERDQFEAKKEALKAQYAAAKANPNMMTGSMADGTQVAGTADELKAAGATGVTKLPAADQSKVSIARQLISPNGLLTNTEKDLAAFKPEELTAIGNRWNEFEAGTLGSGDPRYIALRTDARLLSTALMQAHVGSRGSESIMEHFEGLANAGKMDGDALKTALQTERRYVTEKAMLPKASTTQPKAFSLSAWQKANPTGDVNAAKAAAQQAGYKVVQ